MVQITTCCRLFSDKNCNYFTTYIYCVYPTMWSPKFCLKDQYLAHSLYEDGLYHARLILLPFLVIHCTNTSTHFHITSVNLILWSCTNRKYVVHLHAFSKLQICNCLNPVQILWNSCLLENWWVFFHSLQPFVKWWPEQVFLIWFTCKAKPEHHISKGLGKN